MFDCEKCDGSFTLQRSLHKHKKVQHEASKFNFVINVRQVFPSSILYPFIRNINMNGSNMNLVHTCCWSSSLGLIDLGSPDKAHLLFLCVGPGREVPGEDGLGPVREGKERLVRESEVGPVWEGEKGLGWEKLSATMVTPGIINSISSRVTSYSYSPLILSPSSLSSSS